MSRRVLIAMLFAVFVPSVGSADFVHYTFTGTNGLAGDVLLDASAPFVTECQPTFFCSYALYSPLHSIHGFVGSYEFAGTPWLTILDVAPEYGGSLLENQWIIHSNVSSNAINGRSIDQVHLVILSTTLNGPTLVPPAPRPGVPLSFTFTYALHFSDNTWESGELHTLQIVPEPSTLALLAVALLAVPLVLRWRRLEL